MSKIYELSKAGKIVKVNFFHGEHKRLWDILSEWEGNGENLYEQVKCSVKKKEDTVVGMGYEVGEIKHSCFACEAEDLLEFANSNANIHCDKFCPFQWTDEFGNSFSDCQDIHLAWQQECGENKKRLAKMIRDMPLKEDAKLFYNIVE